MRILFVSSTRIGDAVLSTALLDHLLRAHPAARFTIACGAVAEGVFARMPNRDRTITLVKRPYGRHWLGLWRQVAFTWWDLVVDLRASAISFLVPTRRRVIARGGRHPGHRLNHLAALLQLNPPPQPVAWFAAEDAARAAALVPPGRPLLVLGPSANWDRKVWPADRFIVTHRSLTGPGGPLPGARTVVLAGPGAGERAMAAPVLAAIPDAVDAVGALSLPECAALLSRAALFLGNDSGLMHLAAAAGAPTLGLFGPTPASEYGPVGRRAAAVLADGPPGAAPMAALPVAKVEAAAARLLETLGVPA
ncbi:MAG TPA: glycosyltransferase family 9 protein [Roseomonas sp.]